MRSKFITLLAVAFSLGAVQAASAADMPTKAPMAPMVAPAPVYNWTGFYIGINGGGGWGTTDHTDLFGTTTNNFRTSGAVFGGTYGVNWQFGQWVLGIEGDFDWANIDGTFTSAALCSVSGGTTCFTNLKNFGTDRIRIGYDLNGWLLFGTGGVGYGEVEAGQNPCGFIAPNPGLGVGGGNACQQQWRTGWVAGAGVEKMFAPHWSAKLEYLHYDLGTKLNYNPTNLPAGSDSVNVLERGDMVRAGINYHFDPFNLFH
jgi:outer membrane immunogenic protein